MHDRLRAAGWCPGDPLLFSAAGSSDPRALADVRTAARMLGRRCGQRLIPSYVSTAAPRTADLPSRGAFIAQYLLAPGLFHTRLTTLPGPWRPLSARIPGWSISW